MRTTEVVQKDRHAPPGDNSKKNLYLVKRAISNRLNANSGYTNSGIYSEKRENRSERVRKLLKRYLILRTTHLRFRATRFPPTANWDIKL